MKYLRKGRGERGGGVEGEKERVSRRGRGKERIFQ